MKLSSGIPRVVLSGLLAVLVAAGQARAQTDYFNTDTGRPLTIEDAYSTERYAFELQLAPLRLERMKGGVYQWEVEPEIAYGIFPRTHVEVGAPVSYVDVPGAAGRRLGLSGIKVAMLHNLNVETRLPALAVSADVVLPVGSYAPDEAVASAKAIATRTFGRLRFHLNAQYSFGDDDETELTPLPDGGAAEAGGGDAARWLAGLAVDRTFPLRSTLVGGELFMTKARGVGADTHWNAAVGVRKQLSPVVNIDMGAGRQLNGDDRSWFATFGVARAFAIRSLLPGR